MEQIRQSLPDRLVAMVIQTNGMPPPFVYRATDGEL